MKKYFENYKDSRFWISIILFLGGQSFLYTITKYFQYNYHTFYFYLDDKIPFIPNGFIIVYNLFYPFLFLVFYYIFGKDKKTYDKAIIAAFIGYLICNLIFIIYPVEMIRPDISNLNIDPLSGWILHLTYKYDYPAINCFPSIHCLFCLQTIYSIIRSNNINIKDKILISILASMIIASIFFVKQHYLFDLFGAIIIFVICNIGVELLYDKLKKNN